MTLVRKNKKAKTHLLVGVVANVRAVTACNRSMLVWEKVEAEDPTCLLCRRRMGLIPTLGEQRRLQDERDRVDTMKLVNVLRRWPRSTRRELRELLSWSWNDLEYRLRWGERQGLLGWEFDRSRITETSPFGETVFFVTEEG